MVWAATVALIAGVAYLVSRPAGPVGGDVTGEQFAEVVDSGVRVIDVRTPMEYEGGHVPGAENVPVDELAQASASWDRAQPLAVYCLSGERSANAMSYLQAQGFTTVHNLAGGIGQWRGELVRGASAGTKPGAIATGGRPRMIAFSSTD